MHFGLYRLSVGRRCVNDAEVSCSHQTELQRPGIGVAVSVRQSTFVLSVFSFSLWPTPNFCSSSITIMPRSLNFTSLPSKPCVPMMISIFPSSSFFSVSFFFRGSKAVNVVYRYRKIFQSFLKKFCSAGMQEWLWEQALQPCLPSTQLLNAARTATSVLPKPTSPHTSRSMGAGPSMSFFTSAVALLLIRSVFVNKEASNSVCI